MSASSTTLVESRARACARANMHGRLVVTAHRPKVVSILQAWVKTAFVTLVVRPLLWFAVGLEVRHPERLPKTGPAILVANHNSHFDTLAILSAMSTVAHVRPVGAGDYFFRTPLRAWLSRWFLGIIPLARRAPQVAGEARKPDDVLAPVVEALEDGSIVIFFPEGTRGRAGQIGPFKEGIRRLAQRCPAVSIVPLYLAGFNKVFPKGSHLPLPLLCSITVGEAVTGKREDLPNDLRERVVALGGEDVTASGASSSHLVAARREK